MNRTTRSQSLTEAGRTYCERCRSILAGAEAADALTIDVGGKPQGRLRITAPLLFGRTQLMPTLSAFLRRYGDIEVEVVLTDRCVDLVEEGFEAAFRIGARADSTSNALAGAAALLRVRVADLSGGLRRAVLARRPRAARLPELRVASVLRMPSGACRAEARSNESGWTERLHANDTQAMLSAALDGIGILRAPEPVVREALASGGLIVVLPDHASPVLPLHLLYPADRRRTPKLRRFIEEALRTFG